MELAFPVRPAVRAVPVQVRGHRDADVVNTVGLDVDRPWWPEVPGFRQHAGVFGAFLLAAPLKGAAVPLDLLTVPIARRNSNAYRVLARKNSG